MPDPTYGGGNFNSGYGSAAASRNNDLANSMRDGGFAGGANISGGSSRDDGMRGPVGGNSSREFSSGGLANATRDGGFISAGAGGLLGSGAGFRGPTSTWGSQNSVVPGSLLSNAINTQAALRASPMAPYGNEFNFTPEEVKDALTSLFWSRGIPDASRSLLKGFEKALEEPENKDMASSLGSSFVGEETPGYSVPSGLLESALNTALPTKSRFPEFDRLLSVPSYNEVGNSIMGGTVGSPYNNVVPSQEDTGQTLDGGQFINSALGAQLASIKAGENIDVPTSPAMTGEGWVDIAPGVNVNSPEVQDLIRMAKAASAQTGQRLTITSGVAPRKAGSAQHPAGVAIDLRAYSPVTGKALPNYQSPETFSTYENIAKSMRAAQQGEFPEYNDTFRWGGYFSGGPAKYGALDLMHFDVNNPKKYGMAGGSWDSGLTPQMRETWGINAPTAGSPAGPIAVADAPSPAPAPVRAVMSQTTAATPSLPPSTSTPTMPDRVATNLLGIPAYDTGPGFLGGASKAGEYGTQLLAGSQPQVVEAASAPEAPPIRRPTGAPTSLASLLLDRSLSRGDDRRDRRRKKRSTTTEQTMSDTIGGLLA